MNFLFFITILSVAVSMMLISHWRSEYTCTEYSTVKSIDSLEYHQAALTLMNGQRVEVNISNIGTLKFGDKVCIK